MCEISAYLHTLRCCVCNFRATHTHVNVCAHASAIENSIQLRSAIIRLADCRKPSGADQSTAKPRTENVRDYSHAHLCTRDRVRTVCALCSNVKYTHARHATLINCVSKNKNTLTHTHTHNIVHPNHKHNCPAVIVYNYIIIGQKRAPGPRFLFVVRLRVACPPKIGSKAMR